jgi:hypothetical protein
VAWPLMAAISLALRPASANRRHMALRKPCADKPSGKPAARHSPPNQLVKLPPVNGLPVAVVKNVKCGHRRTASAHGTKTTLRNSRRLIP